MKFEVEVEVNYVFAIEAEDEQSASMIAEMNVDSPYRESYIERTITSVYVEKMEPENTPTESVQISRPGFCQK